MKINNFSFHFGHRQIILFYSRINIIKKKIKKMNKSVLRETIIHLKFKNQKNKKLFHYLMKK